MSKRVSIVTFGCKVNQADSTGIAAKYMADGCQIVDSNQSADICVVNTCTVTAKADLQSRNAIRRLRRLNPRARIIVTGCYANIAPDKLKEMPEVNEVISPTEYNNLGPDPKRTRPQLKIQDGCDRYCAYCIVPYARGHSRSLSSDEVIKRIREIADHGYHEVVLTGIHLGGYGPDLSPKTNLLELLIAIQNLQTGLRVRLSSIDPDEWNDELIDFVTSSPLICPHFHVPLQSGDDEILQKMGRRYTTDEYRELIESLKAKSPRVFIGTDLIVGFPGETKVNFDKTASFIESLPFSYLHVFPYSRRPLTAAAELKETVTNKEKQERVSVIYNIALKKRYDFYRDHVGKILDVIIEGKRDKTTGRLKGISENYIPVLIEGGNDLMGRLCRIKVVEAAKDYVFGTEESCN